ncbi:radical SAM protein [Tateyamaria sp. SN3-11]|uniref:radical SAM protein n=1 Tax=Tateyamaria sp. SN3-11 TaxID=3092147 RepID=UPI0039EB3961
MPFDHTATINFLWLELTNTCNLECTHCYAGSSPTEVDDAPLSFVEYERILDDAAVGGCNSVQFIGGEPTLNRLLPDLIEAARIKGFNFIEVYTNLVRLTDTQIEHYKRNGVRLATSVYGKDALTHDLVTTYSGSFVRTISNIKKALKAGLDVRASVIRMESNFDKASDTVEWLKSIGVENVGLDDARAFGRAQAKKPCDMGELCGECAGGTICVDPNGKVSPCIMSKAWSIGNVREDSFAKIAASKALKTLRAEIKQSVKIRMGGCQPSNKNPCGPDSGNCSPCSPNGNCGPNSCAPK